MRLRFTIRDLLWLTLLVAMVVENVPACAGDGLYLSQVVEKVKENERLYENLDVTLWQIYRDDRASEKAQPPSSDFGGNLQLIGQQQSKVHFVSKGGTFRVDTEKMAQAGKDRTIEKSVRVFNGTQTRVLYRRLPDWPDFAELFHGRSDDPNTVRPHMLLIRTMHYGFPLSIYMQGDEAVYAYPDNRLTEGLKVHCECRGPADFEGHACQKIWITTSLSSGQPHDRWVLWLAEDRNYIPIHVESYTFRWSKDLPVSEANATDWKELQPGVWFPMKAVHVRYDSGDIQSGKKMVTWHETYKVDQVSLAADYDDNYFKDVEFPVGTEVAEVRDRKVIRRYHEGEADHPAPQRNESDPPRR
jgi:hypothetical protein